MGCVPSLDAWGKDVGANVIVLGVDPGSAKFAVVALNPQKSVVGVWEYNLGTPYTPMNAYRATVALDGVFQDIENDNGPLFAYVEQALMGKGGVKVTAVQSFVSGAIQATLLDFGVDVYLVNVSTWKKEVIGKGNVGKPVVREHIISLYPELKKYNQDVIDATAIALYGVRVQERANELN